MKFEAIDLNRKDDYLKRLNQCPQASSDYSFINLWGWGPEYGLEWAWDADLVWIRQTRPEIKFWAPMGDWAGIDWAGRLERPGIKNVAFVRVPAGLVDIWQKTDKISVEPEDARGHWDYLYDRKNLVELSGNRFHKKKNLLRQFTRRYDFHYAELTSTTIAAALEMQTDWCTWRDCEAIAALDAENRAIERVLTGWNDLLGIIGGSLWVDERMVAYTVAEQFSATCLLIHFEKGNPDYKGVYQAINQIFLSNAPGDFTLINREQDLDDPGLRQAKLSYHPVDFIRKYTVTIQN